MTSSDILMRPVFRPCSRYSLRQDACFALRQRSLRAEKRQLKQITIAVLFGQGPLPEYVVVVALVPPPNRFQDQSDES